METKQFILKNKPLSAQADAVVERMLEKGEEILFVIAGDLNLKGRYAETALIFTPDSIVCCDGDEGDDKRYFYSDMREVKAKRMYGNAAMSALMPDGRREVFFRYTYATASLCDAAALFINHINEGEDLNEEKAIMIVTFERALSVCPKCGRTLLHPGAECIMCRSKLKVVKRLSKYVLPHTKTLVVCVILSLLTTAMALVPPAVSGYIVDVVFGSGGSENAILNAVANTVDNNKLKLLLIMVSFLFLSFLFQYGIGMIRAYLMRSVGDKAVSALRNDIYRKAQHLPMKFYDKTSTGSVINRIASDSSTLQQFMMRITQEAVVHAFQLVGIVVVMLALNPILTLLSLIPVVFIVIATRIFSKKIRPYYHRIWRRWSSVFSTLSDTIPCIKVVKSFTGEARSAQNFEEKNEEWLKMDLKIGKLASAFPQIVAFLVNCGTLIIWGIGGSKVLGGEAGFTAGLVVSFITYSNMFYGPVTFFANLSDSFQSALASTDKILDILEAEPETHAQSHVKPDKLKGKIEFLHV